MGLYQFAEDDAIRFAREVSARTRRRGKELQFERCPYCHGGNSDKWTFSISLESGAHNCRRATCGVTGNMLDLARDFNFSLGNDADEYYNPRRRFKSLREYPRPTVKDAAIEYFAGRGIGEKIVRRLSIGVRKDRPDVLVMPFYDEDRVMQFIKYRKTKPNPGENKEWCESSCRPILFGMDQCDPERSEILIMTEGQIDSMSVMEAFDGNVNAVSVPTGAKGFTWVPYCWDFLGKFKTLIVFGDHEHGHITLLDEMEKRFHGLVKHVRPEDYKDCKDANELLVKHGKAAVIEAVEHAVFAPVPEIVPMSKVQRADFNLIERISTGIRELDGTIGGFYMGQLILLTGKRGNGKSTLALQFGVEAMDQGYNVMLYSGEMTDWMVRNWMDRQLAGDKNILKWENRRTGYTEYEAKEEVSERIAKWYSDKAFLMSNENVTDKDDTESLIDITKKAVTMYGCKMIILDNLMSAVLADTQDERTDFYQRQAVFVRKLTKLAKMYQVVILLVVHPRKGNEHLFDNDDISGSSNITDQADVILNYARPDERDSDNIDRLLMVTKSRMSGRTNYNGIELWYQESSKRISAMKAVFDKRYEWENADGYADPDDDDIPFD